MRLFGGVKELWRILDLMESGPQRAAMATVVRISGSAYRGLGTRMCIPPEGAAVGAVSGGCLEDDLIRQGRAVLDAGAARIVTYDSTRDDDILWGFGLGCKGVISVLLEPWPFRDLPALPDILRAVLHGEAAGVLETTWDGPDSGPLQVEHRWSARAPSEQLNEDGDAGHARPIPHGLREPWLPPPALHLFGAGYDARPLAAGAEALGWRVFVYDHRRDYADPARFSPHCRVRLLPESELTTLALGPRDAAVIMSHHFQRDAAVLRALLRGRTGYLGCLGPRQRTRDLVDALEAPEALGRLHGPAGLDLGADSPESIALAILAEVQAVLSGRPATPLKERAGPIHARPAGP